MIFRFSGQICDRSLEAMSLSQNGICWLSLDVVLFVWFSVIGKWCGSSRNLQNRRIAETGAEHELWKRPQDLHVRVAFRDDPLLWSIELPRKSCQNGSPYIDLNVLVFGLDFLLLRKPSPRKASQQSSNPTSSQSIIAWKSAKILPNRSLWGQRLADDEGRPSPWMGFLLGFGQILMNPVIGMVVK